MSGGGSSLMRFLVTIALAILIAAPAASAQAPTTFPVKIKVADASTAVIPNATISFAPDSESVSQARKPIVLKTGHNGTVTANLKPETYAVSVSAPGFISSHLQVKINKSTSLTVELRVASSYSPLVIPQGPTLSTTSTPLRELIPERR